MLTILKFSFVWPYSALSSFDPVSLLVLGLSVTVTAFIILFILHKDKISKREFISKVQTIHVTLTTFHWQSSYRGKILNHEPI
jgi:hypothetical protein